MQNPENAVKLKKYEWQCIEIPAEHWPNPRSTPDERTFMIALGVNWVMPKRAWYKAVQDNKLVVHHYKHNNNLVLMYG